MKRSIFEVGVTLMSLLLVVSLARAGIPQKINFQGKLTDSDGNPINVPKSITFKIYDAQTDGNLKWEETQTVPVTNGIFNVRLGEVTPIDPANVPFDMPYWLEIQVVGELEPMSPRQQITSVGYAFMAENIPDAVITEDKIADEAISDTHISSSAAIADTKLATISTAGKVSGSAITSGTIGGTTSINTTGDITAGSLVVDTDTLYVDSVNNRIGIGTTSPVRDLQVEGNISLGQINTDRALYVHDGIAKYGIGLAYRPLLGDSATQIFTGADIVFSYGDLGSTDDKMIIKNTGNVGIGTTNPGSYRLNVNGGNAYFSGDVSALSFTDRTPYPKDLETAYAAVLSMERLQEGEYDENNKENQLDHSKLHSFIKAQDGEHRDLSAVVSAQNEVIKDLLKRIEELEVEVK